MEKILTKIYHSPCGDLELASVGDRLCMCDWMVFPRHDKVRAKIERSLSLKMEEGESYVLDRTSKELDEYFSGSRMAFSVGTLLCGTSFQKNVWKALEEIPYGETVSYQDIARAVGSKSSVRAAAGAIGANPVSIIVPCHRVIGKNGTLTGYAGGLKAKTTLLSIEGLL